MFDNVTFSMPLRNTVDNPSEVDLQPDRHKAATTSRVAVFDYFKAFTSIIIKILIEMSRKSSRFDDVDPLFSGCLAIAPKINVDNERELR